MISLMVLYECAVCVCKMQFMHFAKCIFFRTLFAVFRIQKFYKCISINLVIGIHEMTLAVLPLVFWKFEH